MRLHYISPSLLPSRAANSVHVVMQCEALMRCGAQLTLYAKRTMHDRTRLRAALMDNYGRDLVGVRLVTFFSQSAKADNLKIAALALADLHRGPRPDAILSRNLYAAYFLAVLERRPLLFETHQLEQGLRKAMQRAIMTRPWVTTVCISDRLVDCLTDHHGVAPRCPLVLHDAAPAGIVPLVPADRRDVLARFVPQALGEGWQTVCGYFGQLYDGRGIEIIEALAQRRPDILFVVFGGNEAEVQVKRRNCCLTNLLFLGHVPHQQAQVAMRAFDVLLMPYQSSVSIGVDGHDTARWMSPMKMFEYLASGVPLIASDLPVLREVLRHGENCLLAEPAELESWLAAIDCIVADPAMAALLGETGHLDYCREHTWDQRARRLLDACETA